MDMPTVQRAFFSHIESGYFYPGTNRNWWMTGFSYGDVVSVTAQSVGGLYGETHGVLSVDNVRVDRPRSGPGGPTLLFRVNNVGLTPVPAYGVAVAWITG
jgi:hypothetical protein